MSTITHPPVRKALKHLDTLYSNEELRLMAERREQALADAEDALDYARHEGEEKGLKKGAAGLLEGLLVRKFGPLPADVVSRLKQADTEQIQAWSFNVLDAESLDGVFC